MKAITHTFLVLISLVPAGAMAETCADAQLTIAEKGVAFSKGCGEGASWQYVVETEAQAGNSSYIDLSFPAGVIARKKIEKYPGEDKVTCEIKVKASYPKGCTFSPSFVGFRGTANVARDHSGLATITLSEASDSKKTLSFSSPPLRGNLGEFAVELDPAGTGFWAPCTGAATFVYALELTLTDLDPSQPGQNLSFIRQRAGAVEIAPVNGLGFKKCVPPPQ